MIRELIATNLDTDRCFVRMSDLPDDEFGRDRVHINSVQAVVKGGGAAGMELICKNADDLQVILSLNASSFRTPMYAEMLPRKKLIEWYARFGFKRISIGCTPKSLSLYMSAIMVRYPRR
mgnify:CR=1 FL=1